MRKKLSNIAIWHRNRKKQKTKQPEKPRQESASENEQESGIDTAETIPNIESKIVLSDEYYVKKAFEPWVTFEI